MMNHILTPLEWASLSPESKTKLVEALVRAFVQGQEALTRFQSKERWGLSPLQVEGACEEARRLLAEGTLGREEETPF